MSWHRVHPDKLQYISLFGFEIIGQNDEFLFVHSFDHGQQIIEKSNPMIWFDDPLEANQLQ